MRAVTGASGGETGQDMTTRHNACVVGAILLAVSTAQADTIYVDVNCPGPGNGSELDPYCSIQTAIDNAVNGDPVTVQTGTYFEDLYFLGQAITVLGAVGAGLTTINGSGPVVSFVNLEGSDSVLDGFTITGGNAVEGDGKVLGAASPRCDNVIGAVAWKARRWGRAKVTWGKCRIRERRRPR